MGQQEILDISLFQPTRPTIRIRTEENPDGKVYELRIQDELSLEQLGEIIGLGEKVQHLQNSDEFEFDEAMVELIGGFFDGMLRIAIVGDYDAELKDLVPVVQKAQIVTAFTETCLGTPTQLATALAEKRQEQTGE